MFELSVAWKYLLPRRRQLSVSIISILSVCVISLVVWLIVLFFSITNGMESVWVSKLISITAPIRITPTPHYYQSYYYQVDAISEASGFAHKSIGDKRRSDVADPYNPHEDQDIPNDWAPADRQTDGSLKDLVKATFAAVNSLTRLFPGLHAVDYETAFGNLHLRLMRGDKEAYLTQAAIFGSVDPDKQPLPYDPQRGDAVLLPKAFRDAGARVGDRGHLSYQSPSISTVQEQRLPVYVAGFYDPGIIPVGGKFVLVNHSVTSLIRAAQDQEDNAFTNGINITFPNYRDADKVKAALEERLRHDGLDSYWKVETFRNFEFAKELLQQLRSDRNLSLIIAAVIILVACSNIVSMLVILVNDKKREIGILRSMGASAVSIALIFGLCGLVLGLIGSVLGTIAAVFTLHHLDQVVGFLDRLQGFQVFSPTFYGESMPNELSLEGLAFVLIATTVTSLLAGCIPAIKASLMKPSAILRSE